ncbi:hypothetical protein [Hellea balneolensis]|uniref:hypothetical protein n=1 Tax=Hellea balneolensis TaxID=287478 RepID=UPI0012B9A780|nr:hypothetical protein [Hellea balneolensis]
MKKIALIFPPLRRVYVDLENRRRRVEELESHIPVLKKQMARAIRGGKSGDLDSSAVSSDVSYLKAERDKLLELNFALNEKYDALYKQYCILSMSNESLVKTNESLIQSEFLDIDDLMSKTTHVKKKHPTARKKSKSKVSGA